MSGEGLVSVRMSKSLSSLFGGIAERQGLSVHEAARRLISRLQSFTPDELKSLKDPPREPGMARLSLYVGWDLIDLLTDAAHDSNLSHSSIFRRLLYGYLVNGEIEFVQKGKDWKLQVVSEKRHENSVPERAGS